MSRINQKLGLKNAGARARLNSLSGVQCLECKGRHVISNKVDFFPAVGPAVRGVLRWRCGFCGHGWTPTIEEIQAYNGRVRERDRIVI